MAERLHAATRWTKRMARKWVAGLCIAGVSTGGSVYSTAADKEAGHFLQPAQALWTDPGVEPGFKFTVTAQHYEDGIYGRSTSCAFLEPPAAPPRGLVRPLPVVSGRSLFPAPPRLERLPGFPSPLAPAGSPNSHFSRLRRLPSVPAENSARLAGSGLPVPPVSAQPPVSPIRPAGPEGVAPPSITRLPEAATTGSVVLTPMPGETSAAAPPRDVQAATRELAQPGYSQAARQDAEEALRQCPEFQAAQERAAESVRRAVSLGMRGATMAAMAEFRQALRIVAQARDTIEGGNTHETALAAALHALKEAEDLIPRRQQFDADLDVKHITAGHRTPVLHGRLPASSPTLSEARRRYQEYAAAQLALAVGTSPVASHALYGMGKIHMGLAGESSSADRLHGPKALVLQLAALRADPQNVNAANEAGVLLARDGRWEEALIAFQCSAGMTAPPEVWQNLALTYERLGDTLQAAQARQQMQAGMQVRQASSGEPTFEGRVTWVDQATFQRAGGFPAPPAGQVAEKPAAESSYYHWR